MSESVSEEPALNGSSGGTSEGTQPLEDEPALTGRSADHDKNPLSALGNEPALLGRGLPTYEQVYRQFRSTAKPSWGWAGVVALSSLVILFLLMLSPIASTFGHLYGWEVGAASLWITTYSPALIGAFLVVPGLVWIERQPWSIPNGVVLALATGGAGFATGLWLAIGGVVHPEGNAQILAVAFMAFIIPAGLSSLGVLRVWNAVDKDGRVPDPTLVIPYAVGAGIVAMVGLVTAWFV